MALQVVMKFDNVPVVTAPAKKRQTSYQRLWKVLLKHTRKGYEVTYEEYYDGQGRLYCRGSIVE